MSENPKAPNSDKENKPNSSNGNQAIFVKGPARQAEVEDLPPDLHEMFVAYDAVYFHNALVKNGVSVRWSGKTMTTCAGLCKRGNNGAIEIVISEPLHKFRTSTELKETLLHEMIHALDFLRPGAKFDHDGHGEFFKSEMKRINSISEQNILDPYRPHNGYHITIFHNFTAEVDFHRKHQWQCVRCGALIKRSMNRPPSEKDCRHYRLDGSKWKHDGSLENARIRNRCGDNTCLPHNHIRTCGGEFTKTAGPEMEAPKANDKGKGKRQEKEKDKEKATMKPKDQAGPSGIKHNDNLDHSKSGGRQAPNEDPSQTRIRVTPLSALAIESKKDPVVGPRSNLTPAGASCASPELHENHERADEIADEIAERNSLMKELTLARQRRTSQGTENGISAPRGKDQVGDKHETPRSPLQPKAEYIVNDFEKENALPASVPRPGPSFSNDDIQVVSVTSKEGLVIVLDDTTPATTNRRARKKQRISSSSQAIVIGGTQEVVDVDAPTAVPN
mmetsp:Transcript_745/g.1246  ORF Transcript_745/g.1246 Transcript_745/m.1246 type:complete len:504 (-) Transcript_745:199-1710(-)